MDDETADRALLQFARIKLKNERLYEKLTPGQRAYLEAEVDSMMASGAGERGNLPHHGAIALLAWLNNSPECHIDDAAVGLGIMFCTAMERWEQARAGA